MNREPGLKTASSRNVSLDVLRIIAVLFVVMIHCSGIFVVRYQEIPSGFLISNILDSISRPGVPLFLMISGALMLNEERQRTTKDMLISARNILLLIVFWMLIYSGLYNILFPIMSGVGIERVGLLLKLTVQGHFHMWYLYMIIGVYLATPFLRKFVKKENKSLVELYLIISLCTTFIKPLISLLCYYSSEWAIVNTMIDKFYLDFFGSYFTYYILGWYIVNIGIEKKWLKNAIYIAGALSLAAIILLTHFTKDYDNAYSYSGILVFLYSTAIFLFVNKVKLNFSDKVKSFVSLLSKLSFGVYIIHPIFNTMMGKVLKNLSNLYAHLPIRFLAVVLLSFLVCYIISKIPIVKKSIRT